MSTVIFAHALSNNGAYELHPLPGQEVKTVSGKGIKYDPTKTIVLRDPGMKIEEGTIFGTDSLTPKQNNGYYVAGATVELISDNKGVIFPDPVDSSKRSEYIKAYIAYKQGTVAAKPKNNRTTRLQILMSDKTLKAPSIEDNGFYVEDDTWYYLLRSALARENILLIGETGVGKTDLLIHLCERLKIPLNMFDMAISNPVPALCGSHRIGATGVSEFHLARFARKIQESGMNVLDELTRAAPSANNVLLPVTDGRRTLYIESSMHDPEIKLHAEAKIWATANIGIQYVGTNQLDSALMNRFESVEVKRPPVDKRIKLMEKRSMVDAASAKIIIDISEQINSDNSLSRGISTRQEIKISSLVYDGYSIAKAFEFVALNQFEHEDSDGGERGKVLAMLQGR